MVGGRQCVLTQLDVAYIIIIFCPTVPQVYDFRKLNRFLMYLSWVSIDINTLKVSQRCKMKMENKCLNDKRDSDL